MKVNYTDVEIDKWVPSTHFQSVVCLIYALLMSCTDDTVSCERRQKCHRDDSN